ncbi:hypothetical protein [Candidatus Methylopumilus planktonicus]|jgi:hypothetical protein|uniref:hypothetical protein n=1 Tax=Candidatus Methylopumilus planktonicus TaxID=1581557 RepID=UPI003BEF31F5
MPKTQITSSSEYVKDLVNSLTHHILESQKSILQACKILADLKNDDNVTFIKVRDELIKKKILSQTAIYGFTKIGSFGNGFFLKHQNKVPLAYKTLLSIAEKVGDDNKLMKKLETHIQYGKINRTTEEKELSTIFNLEKSVPSTDNYDDDQIQDIEVEVRDASEVKIIEIHINRDVLQDKQKIIIRDLKKIKTLMKYASVNEVGKLEEIIDNEY